LIGHDNSSINESISKLREAAAPSVDGSIYDGKTLLLENELIYIEEEKLDT
jgi:hypothetical protein